MLFTAELHISAFGVVYTVYKFLSAPSDLADVFICNCTFAEHAFNDIVLFL